LSECPSLDQVSKLSSYRLRHQEQERKAKISSEGIDLILSLFEKAGQRLFPRNIMTSKSSGQITVNGKDEILQRFEQAQFVDCRINAYPKVPHGTLQTPNIILIDLDIDRSLKTAHRLIKQQLNKTIENSACYTDDDVVPLVLWTGNGYHLYVVLNMTGPLEHIEEYAKVGSVKEISREFLLFAKAFLSDNKADSKNNPSFESCLLRVPYSLNSKCLSNREELDPEVKVIQNWNGHAATMNEITLLLSGFYTHLVGKKVVYDNGVSKATTNLTMSKKFAGRLTNSIKWIEVLLQNGLTEHRKYVISIILAPYFINIKSLSDEDAAAKIKEWLSKCAKIRPLDTVYNFDYWIKYYIGRCRDNKNLKPIRFEDKLPESNPDLYKTIKSKV
jgi:Primase X